MLYIDFGVTLTRSLNGVGIRAVELASAMSAHTSVTVVSRDRPDGQVTAIWPGIEYAKPRHIEPGPGDIYWYGFSTPVAQVKRVAAAGATCIFDAIIWPLEFTTYQNVAAAENPAQAYHKHLQAYHHRLRLARAFTVASPVEQQVLVGMVSVTAPNLLHHSTIMERLHVLPVGVSTRNETRHATVHTPTRPQRDLTLVWNGGLWNHYNPAAVVEAVVALRQDSQPVSLHFLYPQRGTPTSALQAARDAAGDSSAVTFARTSLGMIDRVAVLAQATAAICNYPSHPLWNLCPPMRLRETLLYRLPMIAPREGALGDLITAHGIGAAFDPADAGSIRQAILALTDSARLDEMRQAAARLATDYTYEARSADTWKWMCRVRP